MLRFFLYYRLLDGGSFFLRRFFLYNRLLHNGGLFLLRFFLDGSLLHSGSLFLLGRRSRFLQLRFYSVIQNDRFIWIGCGLHSICVLLRNRSCFTLRQRGNDAGHEVPGCKYHHQRQQECHNTLDQCSAKVHKSDLLYSRMKPVCVRLFQSTNYLVYFRELSKSLVCFSVSPMAAYTWAR